MKSFRLKFVFLLLLLTFIINNAHAGNMKGWASVIKDFMDIPLSQTLDYMYRNQGLVLLDVAQNYAAYSFYREQLTDSQKENVTTVENSSNFVIRFETCKPSPIYTEKINVVQLKRSFKDDVDDFVDNFHELVVLADENQWTRIDFGKSSKNENQIFMAWGVNSSQNNDTFVEIQINKAIHQITWQMVKNCPQ